jgi:PAS domain-containing protein
VIHPDDRPGLIETWQRVLEAGRPKEAEARFRRFDGEYRWYLIRMVPIRDESGAAVRGAEQQFLNIGLPITLKVRRVIVSGDIALLISDWTSSGKAADGSDVNMSGTTADVARRGPDGWKYVSDNPFGTV